MTTILSNNRTLLEGDVNSGRGQFGLGAVIPLTADANLWDFDRYVKYGFEPDALRTITLPTIGLLDTEAQPGHHVLIYNYSTVNSLNVNTSGGLLQLVGPESSVVVIAGEVDPDWRIFSYYNANGNTNLQQAYENNLGVPLQLKRDLIPDRGPLAIYSNEAVFASNQVEELFTIDASPGSVYSGKFLAVRNVTNGFPNGTVFGPSISGFNSFGGPGHSITIGVNSLCSSTSRNSIAIGEGTSVSQSRGSVAVGFNCATVGSSFDGNVSIGYNINSNNDGFCFGSNIGSCNSAIIIGHNINPSPFLGNKLFGNGITCTSAGNTILSNNTNVVGANVIIASNTTTAASRNVLLTTSGSTSTGNTNFSVCYGISSDRGDRCFAFNTAGPGAGINGVGSINLLDTDPILSNPETMNISATNGLRLYSDETTNEVFIPAGNTRSPNFITGYRQAQNVIFNGGAGTVVFNLINNIPTGSINLKIRAVGISSRTASNANINSVSIENTYLITRTNPETALGSLPVGITEDIILLSSNSGQSAGGVGVASLSVSVIPNDSYFTLDANILPPDGFNPLVFNITYEYLSVDNKL